MRAIEPEQWPRDRRKRWASLRTIVDRSRTRRARREVYPLWGMKHRMRKARTSRREFLKVAGAAVLPAPARPAAPAVGTMKITKLEAVRFRPDLLIQGAPWRTEGTGSRRSGQGCDSNRPAVAVHVLSNFLSALARRAFSHAYGDQYRAVGHPWEGVRTCRLSATRRQSSGNFAERAAGRSQRSSTILRLARFTNRQLFRPVQRRDLMANRKAGPGQTASTGRNLDDGGSSPSLRRRTRDWNDSD